MFIVFIDAFICLFYANVRMLVCFKCLNSYHRNFLKEVTSSRRQISSVEPKELGYWCVLLSGQLGQMPATVPMMILTTLHFPEWFVGALLSLHLRNTAVSVKWWAIHLVEINYQSYFNFLSNCILLGLEVGICVILICLLWNQTLAKVVFSLWRLN